MEMERSVKNPLKAPLLSAIEPNSNFYKPYHETKTPADCVRLRIFKEGEETTPALCLGWHMNSAPSIIENHIKHLIGLSAQDIKLENMEEDGHVVYSVTQLIDLPPGHPPLNLRLKKGTEESFWTEEINDDTTGNWGRLRLLNGFRNSDQSGKSTVVDNTDSKLSTLVKMVIDELCCLDTGLTWLASERVILNTTRGICVLAGATMKTMKATAEDSSVGKKEMNYVAPFFFFFILLAYMCAVLTFQVYKNMLSKDRAGLVEYIFSPQSFKDISRAIGMMVYAMLGALGTYFLVSHLA